MNAGGGLRIYAAVALGGSLGGVARWLVDAHDLTTLLAVNVAGSALIGLVYAFSEAGGRRRLPPAASIGLMAGFCGALTTFSFFAIETLRLWKAGSVGAAAGHVLIALSCWIVAAAIGLRAGRWLNRPRPRATSVS